jgi:hypothetical protein
MCRRVLLPRHQANKRNDGRTNATTMDTTVCRQVQTAGRSGQEPIKGLLMQWQLNGDKIKGPQSPSFFLCYHATNQARLASV